MLWIHKKHLRAKRKPHSTHTYAFGRVTHIENRKERTAPLSERSPADSDHDEKSTPIVLSAPGVKAGPSMPMVRKLSNSASAIIGKNAGLVCDATESGKRG